VFRWSSIKDRVENFQAGRLRFLFSLRAVFEAKIGLKSGLHLTLVVSRFTGHESTLVGVVRTKRFKYDCTGIHPDDCSTGRLLNSVDGVERGNKQQLLKLNPELDTASYRQT
jgi:hypothetical protein